MYVRPLDIILKILEFLLFFKSFFPSLPIGKFLIICIQIHQLTFPLPCDLCSNMLLVQSREVFFSVIIVYQFYSLPSFISISLLRLSICPLIKTIFLSNSLNNVEQFL